MKSTGANAYLHHARYFLSVLGRANDLYVRGGEFVSAAIALFDQEFANIANGQSWSSCEAEKNTVAARLCLEYPNAGLYLLDLRLDAKQRIQWLEAAIAAARRLNNPYYSAIRLGNLALAYADLGELKQAIQLQEQSLTSARQIGDRRAEAAGLGNLGSYHRRLGENQLASECLNQCLIIAREIGDRRAEGAVLVDLGAIHVASGDVLRAIDIYNQGLIVLREIGDRRNEGTTLGSLGLAYKNLGDTDRAVECYKEQLTIAREIGDQANEASALGNLGVIFYNSNELTRAVEFYKQQLAIARALGDRAIEGIALGNLGNAYDDLGDATSALKHYRGQLSIMRDICDQVGEANALFNLSITLANIGEEAEALECAEASLKIYLPSGDPKVAVLEARIEELKRRRMHRVLSHLEGQFAWPLGPPSYHRGKSTREEEVRILLVRGESPTGESIYAYCAVRANRVTQFMTAQTSGTFFPEDYGVILESGQGEPSSEIKRKMELEYGFDHDKMQDLSGDEPQES